MSSSIGYILGGKFLSNNPVDFKSSRPVNSFIFWRSKWTRNSSVVPYVIGLPGVFLRPLILIQFISRRVSIVPGETVTPLISSISALETGWW